VIARCAFGDAPTLGDCSIVPQIFNAKRYECDLGPSPRVMRVLDAFMQIDAFAAAQPGRQGDERP
jgi:glutathione S-transferase